MSIRMREGVVGNLQATITANLGMDGVHCDGSACERVLLWCERGAPCLQWMRAEG
jgi:hypothetical protein